MPFCQTCGNAINDSAKFCISCGTKISNSIPTPESTLPTPTAELGSIDDECIVSGVNGQITLSNNRITIARRGAMGFLTQGFKGDKEILISQISSIQYKQASKFTRGFIQFAFTGGQESKGGLFNSVQDENSVLFDQKQQPAFDELKRRIDEIRDSANSSVATPTLTTVPSPAFGLDELERLASFRERGIITDAEFEAKKKEMLGL